jgi:hypothetical protein
MVDVDLGDLELALVARGEIVEDRRDHLARAAPFGPEIHEHGLAGVEDLILELVVVDMGNMLAHGEFSSGEGLRRASRAGLRYTCRLRRRAGRETGGRRYAFQPKPPTRASWGRRRENARAIPRASVARNRRRAPCGRRSHHKIPVHDAPADRRHLRKFQPASEPAFRLACLWLHALHADPGADAADRADRPRRRRPGADRHRQDRRLPRRRAQPPAHAAPRADRKLSDPRAIIIAPTRELAIQIDKDFKNIGRDTGLRSALIYGGVDYDKQRETLKNGSDLIIATPGRLIDYLKQHVFSFNSIEAVVLDEADRMFDLGFIKDIRFLFRRMPLREERQGMLFSATLSHRVLELAYDHMNEPEKLAVETDNVTADRVRQLVYFLRRKRSSRCCSTCCRASTRIAASSS